MYNGHSVVYVLLGMFTIKLECLYSVCQCWQTLQNVNYTDVNKVH